MKRRLRFFENERLDLPDATAVHTLADSAFKDLLGSLVGSETDGPRVLNGFQCRVNPTDNTQILVAPGAALVPERMPDNTVEWTQLMVVGPDEAIVDLSGFGVGVFLGIWVKFIYVEGESDNRAQWRPDLVPEREEVVLEDTRYINDWQVAAAAQSPGTGWWRVSVVFWDGGLVGDNINDRRLLLFEGDSAGGSNPSTAWTIPSFSRSDDRANQGTKTLFSWAMAVLKRIEEIGGRKWYKARVYRENLRNAASEILVGIDEDTDEAFHYTLPGGGLDRLVQLETHLKGPNISGGAEDPRVTLRFVPAAGGLGSRSVVTIDTTERAMTLVAGDDMIREIVGPVDLRRSAGTNAIIKTTQYRGHFRDVTFSAATATATLFWSASGADRLTFTDCVFDGTLVAGLSACFRATAGGAKIRFIRCSFILANGGTGDHVQLTGGVSTSFEDCTFTNGATGINALVAQLDLRVSRSAFAVGEASILTTHKAGVVLSGNRYVTGLVVVGQNEDPDNKIVMDAGVGDDVHAAGPIGGHELRARGGTVAFDASVVGSRIQRTSTGDNLLLTAIRNAVGAFADLSALRYYSDLGVFGFSRRGDVKDIGLIPRLQRIGNRIAFLDTPSENGSQNLYFQARRIILGRNPAAVSHAKLHRDITPKAWGVIKRTDGVAFNPAQHARGITARGTAVETVAVYGDQGVHRYSIRGLELPDALYAAFASFVWGGGNALRENQLQIPVDGGFYRGIEEGRPAQVTVSMLNQTADGFDFVPMLGESRRVAITGGVAGVIEDAREIYFRGDPWTADGHEGSHYLIAWSVFSIAELPYVAGGNDGSL